MPAGLSELQKLLERIISLSVGVAFVALLIMFIVGGFRYLTSGGDQKATASAQQTLTYAVVGIFLLVGAWLALKLVETFTGVQVTQFCLKFSGPGC